jgi:hypothetical protein
MSHSVGRTHAADEVRLARRRIIDRIKVLAKQKTDADVYRLIRVPPDTARTALFQRPDVEIGWEHRLFDILADFGEARALVDDLRRAKSRFVEIDGSGTPYRTLRGMKGHEILSLPLSEVWEDDEGQALRRGRRLYKLFDDGIAEAVPLNWRNAATYHIDTLVIAARSQHGDVVAFRNASALLLDMLSEPFNARDDFLNFLRVVYRGAGDLAAQFVHEGALARIVWILAEKQKEANGHPGCVLCDRMINEYSSLMIRKYSARQRRAFALEAHSKIGEGIKDRTLWDLQPDLQHGWASTSFNVIQSEPDDDSPRTLSDRLKAHDDVLAEISAIAGTAVKGFHTALETFQLDEPHAAQFVGHELLETAVSRKSGSDAEKALTVLNHSISKIEKNGPARTIVAQLMADRAKAFLLISGEDRSADFQTYEWEVRSAANLFADLGLPKKRAKVLNGLGSLERRMRIAHGPAQQLLDYSGA